jgi:hypothetical protein
MRCSSELDRRDIKAVLSASYLSLLRVAERRGLSLHGSCGFAVVGHGAQSRSQKLVINTQHSRMVTTLADWTDTTGGTWEPLSTSGGTWVH